MGAIYKAAQFMWQEMHAAWEDLNEAEFQAAEDHCNGFMVGKRAKRTDATNREVWGMSRIVQKVWGSEELNAWLEEHPKTTLKEFELQWMKGRVMA